ncbi:MULTISPECIES: DUF3052 domain-containing protein [unclassified Pseudofrankia]|uniref:DUF3052 domain-containing protein n=1 Tax=unclassified Pseudofrankia TaxID=2994372 RepID=UPI0008DA707B|nr:MULTISPECIES: DUF3052 domain-containing protein [unclassified Pseudofrankia]MDT3438020.1 DUF3052 domain-containing protein [Pseudofrankia sp. BMG5.37]OHV57282.1 hypothetical protein BCD48_06665 [Pseudofrankia sp. BMG5.36]
MSPTAANAEGQRRAERLGVVAGTMVQSINEDDDIAGDLLEAVVAASGTELVPEDSDDVVDIVLLWWRDDDGDLANALIDARRQLSDQGIIWLVTPKSGRPGHVEPSDILDAVPTAGLVQTSTVNVAQEWAGMRLAAPKSQRVRHR